MKHLLVILVASLFLTACDNSEKFASVSESSTSIEASTEPEYKEEIRTLVSEDVEIKVAGKKRQTLDVIDTVGEKDLKKPETIVTHIDVTSEVVVKTELEVEVDTETAVSEEEVKQEPVVEKVDLGPELNILVYMSERAYGNCVDRLRKEHVSFLDGISHYNWDISFAYYTNKAELLPLEYYNGKPHNKGGLFEREMDYILSKGEYSDEKAKRLFQTTLQPSAPLHEHSQDWNLTPNSGTNMKDPLFGLDQILSSEVRKSAQTIVLFEGDQFPYYSTSEWDSFYSSHPNVSVIALSFRSANVSNFLHVLEKAHDFRFIAGCDSPSSFQKVISAVNSVVE